MLADPVLDMAAPVTVTMLDNPFEPELRPDRHSEQIPWGLTIEETLPERVRRDPSWLVIENGKVLPREEWSRLCGPGTELLCAPMPGDGVGRILAGVVLMAGAFALGPAGFGLIGATGAWGIGLAGAGLFVGGAADLIIGAPKLPALALGRGDFEGSPTYGFEGIQNTTRIGAPIPVVYGTHRVGGVMLSLSVRSDVTVTDTALTGTIASIAFMQGDSPERWHFTGSGTAFTTQLAPGDLFAWGPLTNVLRVWDITDDTHLSIDPGSRFNHVGSGVGITKIGNAPTTAGNDVLYMLLALSEGEIAAVTDLKINNQPVANYRGVETETRLGTGAQTSITFFGDSTSTTIVSDATLTESFGTYTTTGKDLTGFEVNLSFPQGLFTLAGDGSIGNASVLIELKYKLSTAGSYNSPVTYSIVDAKRAIVRRTLRVEGIPAGQYDIQVRRTSPQSTSLTLVDEVHRTSVNEIVNEGYRYPHTALLAVKAIATDQLSGTPTITALVQGIKIKVFSSATAFSVAHSNNPAWVVFDMLTNTRYGHGKFTWPAVVSGSWTFTNGSATVSGSGFTNKILKGQKILVWLTGTTGAIYTVLAPVNDTSFTLTANFTGSTASYSAEAHRNDLDLQSFVDWATFCDVLVDDGNGGTEKRATCDVVFDADSTKLWDAVIKVCGVGLAAPIKLGNYLRIKYQAAESPAQLFSMANIVKDSFREEFLPLKERANYYEVSYLNASNDYAQEMIVLQDPLLFTNAEPERKQTVSLYGVTRSGHAARLARFYQNSNRYLTRTITFEAGLDAIRCEPGDVIRFQHDLPGWGLLGIRAAAGATSGTFKIDSEITLAPATTYEVLVRHSDDTIETKTITTVAGTYPAGTALTISGTWTSNPVDGDVMAIGVVSISTKPFRIISLTRTPQMTAKISAIEYNANVYDETGLTPVNVVQYSTLPDPASPPDHVTNLTLTQQIDSQHTVWVGFEPPRDSRYAYAKIYQMNFGVPILLGQSRSGGFAIQGQNPTTVLAVTVVSVSRLGSEANLLTAPSAAIIVGSFATQTETALPSRVTGLELVNQGNLTSFVGRDAKFQWRDRSIISGFGIEEFGNEVLGFGQAVMPTRFVGYLLEILNTNGTLRRTETTREPRYTYSYEKNFEDGQSLGTGPVREFQIRVWQLNSFNQQTTVPAQLTVSNPAPAVPTGIVVIEGEKSLIISFDRVNEPDVEGYKIWRSPVMGFTPDDAANLVKKGPETRHEFNDVTPGTPYYFRIAAFDSFGET